MEFNSYYEEGDNELLIEKYEYMECLRGPCQSRTEEQHYQEAASPNENVGYILNKERRILLVGKTGAGKSATGSTILGRDAFGSRDSPESVTSKCQIETSAEKKVVIVDTPGIFDTNLKEDELIHRISECVVLCPEGFHAVVVVLSLASGGRFTEFEKEAVHTIKGIFGEGTEKHMIVLFTGKDQLTDVTIQDYIKGSKDLTELMNKCGDRYCAFNNLATGPKSQEQVSELLVMIDKMVEENGGGCYTSEMFDLAKQLQQKVEHLRSNNAEGNSQDQKWDIFKNFQKILKSVERVPSCTVHIIASAVQHLNVDPSQATTNLKSFWLKVKQFFQWLLKLLDRYCNLQIADRSKTMLLS